MTSNDAWNNLHKCNCVDHAEHIAYDWHESGCKYREWYTSNQQQRKDETAERGKILGFWKA